MAVEISTRVGIAEQRASSGSSLRRAVPHVVLGDIPIFDGTSEDALAFCMDALERGEGARIATANLDFFAIARTNEELVDDLQRSSIVVADGAPVVALGRLAGARRIERTTGVDFALALCREGGRRGPFRVAMYGSDPETADRAARALEATSPGVEIVLRLSPPFRSPTPEERAADRAAIAACDPHLVLVALGCPKQERVIREYFDAAPQALWIGIGGAFDFFAGKRRRAAPIFQRLGLEWVVRLVQDPRRLASRYLRRDLPVLPPLLAEAASLRFEVHRPRWTRARTSRQR